MMDKVYYVGALFIRFLQDVLPHSEKYFIRVSELTDPAYAFTVVFPAASVLSVSLGADILAVSVAAEWSNILLKWLLMEDRPYWWVKEEEGRPLLEHTKLTCETGPGSPSGHCTGATVIGFVLAQWLCKQINEKTLIGRVYKRRLNKIIWMTFCFVLVNVTLSRLFNATHFPHQCFLGIACGLLVNYTVSNDRNKYTHWWRNARRLKLLLVAFLLTLFALAAYWLQRLIGIDPQWSVRLAFKWCSSPDYLHVNTTPMFSLVRDSGAAFGLALSSPTANRGRGTYSKIVAAILTLFVCSAVEMAGKEVPTTDYKVFYSCMFMLNAVQPYFILVIVPYVASLLGKIKRD